MALSTYACIMFALFLVPFVGNYTDGITDINYIRPVFAYFLVAAEWVAFIRIPYATSITSAGHYRQTKFGAIDEAAINIGASMILVYKIGICGVVLGTLIAVSIRTIYFIWYLSHHILKRSVFLFIKSTFINLAIGKFL